MNPGMILTIETTFARGAGPAGMVPRDLGFLLHKHPDRLHVVELPFGTARMGYPAADDDSCRFALAVEVDPVALTRGRRDGTSEQYVNDRPYAVSSRLSVALGRCLKTAMAGRCASRPELAEAAIPLAATVLPISGTNADLARDLFAPLGYAVAAEIAPPARGDFPPGAMTLTLADTVRMRDLLSHLSVLLPVLDGAKHYFVEDAEVDKLLHHGGDWLAWHPMRDFIARRYLKGQRSLARDAIARLVPDASEPDGPPPALADAIASSGSPLDTARKDAVVAALAALGARSVADLGCGEGRLLERLARDAGFTRVLGMDVSASALGHCRRRLGEHPGALPGGHVEILQGSLLYRDSRLSGFDAVVLSEVIEHVDPCRLPALEREVFGAIGAGAVIVTTPNREWNAVWGMEPGALRHDDHRFEWDRAEFSAWAERIAEAYGYSASISGIGIDFHDVGSQSQIAVFKRT